MKIAVLGLASSVHGEEYYRPLYEGLVKVFREYESIHVVEKPIIGPEEHVVEADVYLVIHLTGGTSGLAYRLFSGLGRPVVLIASGEHNALASALSARAKLLEAGVKTLLIEYVDLEDYRAKVGVILKALETVDKLSRLNVLEVNREGAVSKNAKQYMESIGGVIEAISYRELLNLADKVSTEELEQFIEEIGKYYVLPHDRGHVEKVVRLTIALEKLVREKGYEAVTIDCFPMIMEYGVTPCLAVSYLNARGVPTICEDDFYSLPLMLIAREITSYSGWIANPSGSTREGYLRFAHCTIGYDLGRECKLVNHFETGKPYGVTCKYGFKKVLFGRFTRDYKKLLLYSGHVIESGLLSDKYCRTQLLVETPGLTPEKFYSEAVGNHHVFLVDKPSVRKALEIISWWMNWEIQWMN